MNLTDVLIETAKQVPSMVLLVIIVWMFLNAEDKREAQRVANAKQHEQERTSNSKQLDEARQKHESEMNAMWAGSIKNIIDEQNKTAQAIVGALAAHDKASAERYERMNITKDLLDAAKDRERERERRK